MSSDDKLIFLLTIVQQGVKNYANKALLAAGVRITLAQSGVLFLLEQQDRRMMSEIGRILGIENSAMTGLIDRLEKAGFVTRIADPEDRRALLICVTPAGLEEAEKAKLIIRGVNNEIKSGFSERQVDVFSRVLDGLSKKFKGI